MGREACKTITKPKKESCLEALFFYVYYAYERAFLGRYTIGVDICVTSLAYFWYGFGVHPVASITSIGYPGNGDYS